MRERERERERDDVDEIIYLAADFTTNQWVIVNF